MGNRTIFVFRSGSGVNERTSSRKALPEAVWSLFVEAAGGGYLHRARIGHQELGHQKRLECLNRHHHHEGDVTALSRAALKVESRWLTLWMKHWKTTHRPVINQPVIGEGCVFEYHAQPPLMKGMYY